jgi:succinyl-CoA synthetase beta subunit
MATMDIVTAVGASPANFLDVGGGADEDRIRAAVRILLSDPNVKRVLVNIFGGILRNDVLARGLVGAYEDTGSKAPIIARMLGTNVEEGRQVLRDSGLDVTVVETLKEAADALQA